MSRPDITIIIPTLSNHAGLEKILADLRSTDYRVLVINNNPNYSVKTKSKNINILVQKSNLGFARAVNLAAKKVKTEWMLILNDDIDLSSVTINQQPANKQTSNNSKSKQSTITNKQSIQSFLPSLLSCATKNNWLAASPILLNDRGEVENLGYQVLPTGKVKLIKTVSSYTFHVSRNKLDGLTAAFLLIKTSVFDDLNGFDESFFAYLEDVDLFLRLKHNSLFIIHNSSSSFGICPSLSVLHRQGTTSSSMGSFKARRDVINWWRLILKHPRHFRLYDPINLFKLLVERGRNLSGLIKAVINK